MTVLEKLQTLRTQMEREGIAFVVVPSGDAHLSEYVCDHYQLRAYLSGFTGSAGTLVVGLDWAGLWTDGRYHTQAAQQLEGTSITLYPAGKPEVPTMYQELTARLQPGQTVAVDGTTISKAQGDLLKTATQSGDLKLQWRCPACVWPDRPALPQGPLYAIDNAGQTAQEKLQQLHQELTQATVSAYLLTTLEDIAWVLNLRGWDLPHTPVFLSYLWITPQGSTLFVEKTKVPAPVVAYLEGLDVTIAPYETIEAWCAHWTAGQVWVDGRQCNACLYQLLGDKVADIHSPAAQKKAIKTPSEIENLRTAHQNDALAMLAFLHWLEQTVVKEPMTEVDVARHLDGLRAQQPGYISLSFDTICGYGANGAIIHYSAQEDTCAMVQPEGLLLVDSGGQYTHGTTDITRTICLGALTPQMRRDFTLVLKGHLALAAAVFPKGTTGSALDVLARQPLWMHGLDYLHGTGHGVGYRLGVHEGPQTISHQRTDNPPLAVGMVTSDEPGYYLPGSHGIRLENLLVCQEAQTPGFLCFETLTLVPFDVKALELSLFTQEDRDRLNAYHARVYATMAPLVSEPLAIWLEKMTAPV